MSSKIARFLKWLVIVLGILGIVIAGFMLRHPPDPLTLCQKVLDGGFEQWKLANKTTSFPNVEGDSRKSFEAAGQYMWHWEEYYAKYGYVPGLKEDDPSDMVLMYLREKTRRSWNGDFSGSILREKKWMVIGPQVIEMGEIERCPEGGRLEETSVFKARLQKTLDFLEENKRPHWETVTREHAEFLKSVENDTSHYCINAVKFALEAYARKHNGSYPAGEATPEASLNLLYKEGYLDAHTMGGGWHYVEGMKTNDHESIAILWSKSRRGHHGERRSDNKTEVLFADGHIDRVTAFPGDKWARFVDEQESILFDHKQQSGGIAPVLKIDLQFPDGQFVHRHHGAFDRVTRFQLADGRSGSNVLSKPKLEPQHLRWFRSPVTNGMAMITLDMDTCHLMSDTGTVHFLNGNATPSNIVLHMRRVPCTHKK
jgi:hypothetical protein